MNIDPKTKEKQETQNNETLGNKDVKHKKVVYKGKRAIYPKKKPDAKQREITNNKQKVSAFSGNLLFFFQKILFKNSQKSQKQILSKKITQPTH